MIKLYVALLGGGLIGWVVNHYLGMSGDIGMMCGGAAFLAYETRQQARLMKTWREGMDKQREGLDKQIDFIRSLER